MSSWNRRFSIASWRLLAAWLLWATAPAAVRAAPGDWLFTIPNPDAESYSHFGEVIAATTDTIVVGAPQTHVDDIPFAGRAYVFDAQDGAFRYALNSPEPDDLQQFGWSAAIADGRVVVGSTGIDGAAYVFDEQSGAYQRKITNPDARNDSTFTLGLTSLGDRILVGSPQHFVGNVQDAGGVFLIAPATGGIVSSYENPVPTRLSGFSGRGAIAGNHSQVFVGQYSDKGPDGRIWGSVWAFEKESGEPQFKVVNPQPDSANLPPISDFFGLAIAADDQLLVVGAQLEDYVDAIDAGAVHVYSATTGEMLRTIANPSPSVRDEFGGALAMVNGDILVGASRDGADGLENSGTAYLFDGWTGALLMTLRSPEPEQYDFFGYAVAATGGRLIVASPNDLPVSEVFVFEGLPERIAGDTNRDGVVDLDDLNNVRNDFGLTGYGMCGDANRDYIVDLNDLNAVRNHFGEGSGSALVPEPSACGLSFMNIAACAIRIRRKLVLAPGAV